MQSEGATKERVGKLYFIIMLSRWQEASVNKKYEAVIGEVQTLRSELLNQQTLCKNQMIKIESTEGEVRKKVERIVHLEHEV